VNYLKQMIVLMFFFLAAGAAHAQAACSGGTAASPACVRNWATAPLVVTMCPSTATNEGGVRLVMRELNDTPLLSASGTPGSAVSLPSTSAPSGGALRRTVKLACEDGLARLGGDTFVDLTFPKDRPLAPVLP